MHTNSPALPTLLSPLRRVAASLVLPMTLLAAPACGDPMGPAEDPANIPAEELVQSGCSVDADCPGGTCIAGIGTGLCTAVCSAQEDCPEGTICTDTEAAEGTCLLACSGGSYCTDHLGPEYNCDEESSLTTDEDVRVCIDGR